MVMHTRRRRSNACQSCQCCWPVPGSVFHYGDGHEVQCLLEVGCFVAVLRNDDTVGCLTCNFFPPSVYYTFLDLVRMIVSQCACSVINKWCQDVPGLSST